MDPKELLKLLDLDGRSPDRPVESGAVVAVPATATRVDAGPTALVVDAWGLRRGRDLLAESDRLKRAGTDAFAAADFFTAAFDPGPRLNETCVDPRRHQFLTHLLGTPEYRALHAATRLDDTAAGIAATHFAEQFASLKPEDATEPPPGAGDSSGDEMATLRAVGRAVAEAGKEVAELHEAAAGLGMGMGPGTPGRHDPAAVAAMFQRVRSDPALRRICDLAGGSGGSPSRGSG
ncbi:hypothetical protein [Fimbriiglobus ruber]|uniref:Uncharacterized protein n=1 Tax=Fimbriiglobus ruber TaxID=1908690 RepID=A0A225DIE9_9BACT|nr:hypothetical protein [Fimbriiglobus ruber]OWK41221.1 hypothetical protein FRUB_04584 [Fimbriiglobus ruber]